MSGANVTKIIEDNGGIGGCERVDDVEREIGYHGVSIYIAGFEGGRGKSLCWKLKEIVVRNIERR